jgi:hypothetical protein
MRDPDAYLSEHVSGVATRVWHAAMAKPNSTTA